MSASRSASTFSGSVARSTRKLSRRRRNVPHSKRLQPMTSISARSLEARRASVLSRSVSQKPGSPARLPRAVHERRPEHLPHRVGQAAKTGRVAVDPREARLVEERAGGGHAGDLDAVGRAGDERAVGQSLRAEPRRVLRGLAVDERHVVPVGVVGVEGAADVEDVDAEAVEDRVLRLGELLHDIVHAGVAAGEAEVSLELAVGDRRDAGAGRRAEVQRHAVGLAVLDGGEDAFARVHGAEKVHPPTAGDVEGQIEGPSGCACVAAVPPRHSRRRLLRSGTGPAGGRPSRRGELP